MFLHTYFWSGTSMYVSPWLNAVAAVQMFFIVRIFVFFMALFLKKMRMILSASKLHYHSRLSKPILTIYRKNNLGNYALNTFSDYFIHQTFNIFTKSNRMINVAKLFTGVRSMKKVALMNFIGKHLPGVSFVIKFYLYRLKRRLPHKCFLASFLRGGPLFWKTPLGDCFC